MTTIVLLRELPVSPTSSIALIVLGLLGACFLYLNNRDPIPANCPPLVKGEWPILGSLGFFSERWDFFQKAIASSPSGQFSFHAGKAHVIGISGPEARHAFFENRQLGFAAGYNILFGQAPTSKHVPHNLDGEDKFESHFSRRLITMVKRENLAKGLPYLISDTRARLDELASKSRKITDPFDSIYRIVYQLTMRTVGCNDIAEDPKTLEKTLKHYETFEASSTATSIIFPKIPTPAVLKRTYAATKLYMNFNSIVAKRKRTGERGDDPLQYMIDQGDDIVQITQFILGALFAGQLNSGINAAYVLCHLGLNAEWMAKARAEIESVAREHAINKDAALIDQLASLRIEIWDSQFHVLDLCLRDSIRLSALGAAFRRNVSGRDIKIGNEVIPHGAFVTYHFAETHQDPNIFSNPMHWDPSRYLRGEDKKLPYAFAGWGAGRHPCLGMKFAKLEQNIIIALFLAKFEFETCDVEGQRMEALPDFESNAWSAKKPSKKIYLKYWERV